MVFAKRDKKGEADGDEVRGRYRKEDGDEKEDVDFKLDGEGRD